MVARMGEEILTMKDVVKIYYMGGEELVVLKGINLSVMQGDFIAVLGPSGSGKSTLMNIIGCLDTPTSGEYYLSGRKIGDQSEKVLAHIRNKEVGFIFQSFQLMPRYTALKNVELPMVYASMSASKRRERAIHMLERVGLEDRMYHRPTQLSGGQQQRVAIARAMSTNPTILLADEPTGALDQRTGKQVLDLFCELNADGHTIIMITHDPNIAAFASKIVYILDGELKDRDDEHVH